MDLVRREIVILSKMNHANVMKFYGATLILPNVCIVTELLSNGSLDEMLYASKPMDWALKIRMAIDVALGLEYLHTLKPAIVIHRDIKSANVLLDDKLNSKLSDFGLAKFKTRAFEMPTSKELKLAKPYTVILNSSPVGTAAWCAPEMLEHAPYNEMIDIYSFGVFLWELQTRECPYRGGSNSVIIAATLEKKYLEIPTDTHPIMKSMMIDCWKYDPWERPTATELIVKLKEFRTALGL